MAEANLLDQLIHLSPSAALSIALVVAATTVTAVLALIVLGKHFARLTPSQRRDVIRLAEVISNAIRRRDR